MRKQTQPHDITPDLTPPGVLANYEQFEEMQKVIKDVLKIQPENEILKELEEWIRKRGVRP